ncbi:hypothetical protein B5S28_g3680 [[Candida] boidinii]|nr:hypothetical protein B5S28_g3680 [[Candida] boidinii]OWB62230.1 hypothetical protein B5S29_g3152 [[Candida] boidinii]OWB74651.1 hypothetical protein B5S31_g4463 [[Candida] boidinii]OWB78496.1 hypothetical protein B5S32_g2692 [[Candida] boidinii]GMF10205.1 unnamed protein product [[Candida] boidinii]
MSESIVASIIGSLTSSTPMMVVLSLTLTLSFLAYTNIKFRNTVLEKLGFLKGKTLYFPKGFEPPYNKEFRPVPASESNNKNRKYGEWTPEEFKYPVEVKAYPNWSLTETTPIAYRAFRHTYHITMGIRSMDWHSWIELDNEWMKYHNRKLDRIAERGSELYGTLPEAWNGAIEYLSELREYLPKRYPTLFVKTDRGINNIVTGDVFEFLGIKKEDFKQDPMLMASLMTQDDLAVMVENEEGEYVLKGGSIMLAGFWRLKDKLNLPLTAIHTTGDVPKYNEKLKSGMDKFFMRLTTDKPVVRNNYFLQTDDDVAWSFSIGDEANDVVGWYTAENAKTIDQLYYRSERQSVRRLPLTGNIAFTIRTYFLPVTKMCDEPYVPRRLLNGIESWTEDVQEYRGFAKFKDVLMPYLKKRAEEQEAQGYTVDNEPQSYPF